ALGLDYSPTGTFEWKGQGSETPLFELYSGEQDRFALAQVQSGVTHSVLGMGFSVPLCPDPMQAFDGCVRAGNVLAQRLDGTFLDDDDKQVTEMSAMQMRSNLQQAISALR